MDSAKKSTGDEPKLLQEFKSQLENVPDFQISDFSLGSVKVKENIVETSDGEEEKNPDNSGCEEMTLLQKACYFQLYEFAQELVLNRKAFTNQTGQKNGTPPILLAAYHGDLNLIKLLYENRVSHTFLLIDRST